MTHVSTSRTPQMSGLCDGRIVIVHWWRRWLGRSHAPCVCRCRRARRRQRHRDVARGRGRVGRAGAAGRRRDFAAAGGEAVANTDDVTDWDGAGRLVQAAIGAFGGLDVLVNNAGFLRDRMLTTMSVEEWDAVVRVHLRGHFCPLRQRGRLLARSVEGGPTGRLQDRQHVSGAGLMGSVGQGNYSAAKAGILGLTVVAAAELARYGVTVNAIAPAARTRMTESAMPDMMRVPDEGFDAMAPDNVSPLVVWLGKHRVGRRHRRVFEVRGRVGPVSPTVGNTDRGSTRARRAVDAAELGSRRTGPARQGTAADPGLRCVVTLLEAPTIWELVPPPR